MVTLFARAGHLAVWLGFYVTAAVVFVASSVGRSLDSLEPLIFPFAFLTASSVYLIDRVKLTNAQLDPADQQAHPDRFAYLTSHPRRTRLLASVLSVTALGIGSLIHPLVSLLVLLALAGVIAYATPSAKLLKLAGKKRFKDLFLVKNFIVSFSITAFAAAAIVLSEPGFGATQARGVLLQEQAPLAFACIFASIVILADAILCDIDDVVPDRTFSTSTIPVRFGTAAAWLTAIGLNAVAFGMAATWPAESALKATRLRWAGLILATTLILAAWRPHRIRDLVDIRLGLVAIVMIYLSS